MCVSLSFPVAAAADKAKLPEGEGERGREMEGRRQEEGGEENIKRDEESVNERRQAEGDEKASRDEDGFVGLKEEVQSDKNIPEEDPGGAVGLGKEKTSAGVVEDLQSRTIDNESAGEVKGDSRGEGVAKEGVVDEVATDPLPVGGDSQGIHEEL